MKVFQHFALDQFGITGVQKLKINLFKKKYDKCVNIQYMTPSTNPKGYPNLLNAKTYFDP